MESVTNAIKSVTPAVLIECQENKPRDLQMKNFIPGVNLDGELEQEAIGFDVGADTSGVFRTMTFSEAGAFLVLIFTAIFARIR